MQQTQIFFLLGKFFPLQINFFGIWREFLRTGLSKIGHDEIIMKFTVLVQSFLYIFKSAWARLYNEKMTYKSVIQLLCIHSCDQC